MQQGFKCLGWKEEEEGEITLVWCKIGRFPVAEMTQHLQLTLLKGKFKIN